VDIFAVACKVGCKFEADFGFIAEKKSLQYKISAF
jgi:hypothetical protein